MPKSAQITVKVADLPEVKAAIAEAAATASSLAVALTELRTAVKSERADRETNALEFGEGEWEWSAHTCRTWVDALNWVLALIDRQSPVLPARKG